jgi:Domain of unknown function (DUF4349)
MERSSEHDELAVALAELRPTPDEDFARALDERAAAGFPRRSRLRRLLPAGPGRRLRVPRPRQIAFVSGAAALVAIAIATALVTSNGSNSESIAGRLDSEKRSGGVHFSEAPPAALGSEGTGSSSAGVEPLLAQSDRDIERSAQVTLLAAPGDVAADSAEVFAAVHDAHGIVLRSRTRQGSSGGVGATFHLLIPSARLGDALAAISGIDEVGSRNDATADITAPTVAVGKRLHSVHARIDALRSELGSVETGAEREALETQIRKLRRDARTLQAQLDRLHKRARYSHLTVRIATGASSGSTWGIGDAFHDAGRILAVAAGVTLVGLAVLAPIALLLLLAWLARRAWLRRARNRALS